MSVRSLQQGIEAIQQGHLEEGARLLRLAIRDDALAPHLKATAFAWLSNTQEDVNFKIECYQKAVAADPQNATYAQHLNTLMASQVPTPQKPPPPPPPDPYAAPYQQPPQNPNPQGGYPQQGGYPPQQNPPGYPPTSTGQYPQVIPNAGQGYPPLRPNPDPFGPSPTSTGTYQQPRTTGNPIGAARSTSTFPSITPNTGQGGYPAADPYARISTGTFGTVGPVMTLNEAQRSVGVVGGPNGKGSGLFVTRDGLIATTRFVVGSEDSLTIQLASGQTLAGQVLRSFPQFDLALIKVPVQLVALLPVAQVPILAENLPLMVLSHPGEVIRTARRETRGELPPQWFPTLLNRLQDAGGDPIFDPQNALVGMMTRNASRTTSYFYGLHISAIYQCVQMFLQEAQQLGNQGIYCSSCGSSSRAGAFKAYYCETCGSVLPPALDIRRRPMENVGALYGETMNRPCPNCRATIGFYNGVCLRCGFEAGQRR